MLSLYIDDSFSHDVIFHSFFCFDNRNTPLLTKTPSRPEVNRTEGGAAYAFFPNLLAALAL
jgi:hypothetical protein